MAVGCGSSQPSAEELAARHIAVQRELSPDSQSSDQVIRQSLDNGCNVTKAEGTSMDVLVSASVQPTSMTREEYVAMLDEYCAKRG